MSDPHLDDARKSRRRVLQAAAAAGVGIGAFGAPGVSVVPAYGLTNSVVNDKCFFIMWRASAGGGRWGTNNAATNADSTAGTDQNRTYTWNDPTGKGTGSLVITATGDANTAAGASFTVSTPGTCAFIVSPLTGGPASGFPRSTAPNPDEPCRLTGSARSSQYTTAGFAASDSGTNVLIFDLVC